MRQLWTRVAFTSGARIYVILTGLVGLVITARVIGPEGRGAVAAVTTWVTLFVTMGHMSLGPVALHEASASPDDSWLGPVFGTLLLMCGMVSAGCLVVALVLGRWSDMYGLLTPLWLMVGLAALPFQLWELYGSSMLMALDRIDIYNRFQVIGRTGGMVLMVTLLALGGDVTSVLVSTTLGQVAIASGGMRYLWRRAGGRVVFDPAVFRRLAVGGMRLHLNAIGFFLTTSINVLVLNYYRGPTETGLFQFSTQLTFALLVIPQAAAAVLFGTISQQGAVKGWKQQRVLLVAMTGLMSLAVVITELAAPFLVISLAGQAFVGAVAPFRIILLSLIGMTISTMMGPQWIARGLFIQSSAVAVVGGVANLAISVLFVKQWGMLAPAWASAIIYSAAAAASIAVALKAEREWRQSESLAA